VRPDQTDPGTNRTTSRADAWNPNPADIDDDDVRRRERPVRAGSPGPTAMTEAGATSWQDIKSRFVDDPEGAIAAAEELVRLAVDQKLRRLKDESAALLEPDRGEDASSTEARRTRLIRYQEYCQRLAESTAH
jgi:hypothetical protein